MPCPRCRGTGLCQECQGQGSIECPACSGAGKKSTPRGSTYACKSCQGEGHVPCSAECASCDGTGEITEELQNRVQQTYRLKFANFGPSTRIVLPLMVVNVLLFGAQQAWPREMLALYPTQMSFAVGHWWVLLTSSFLHGNLLHLGLNMWFLWVFGPPLEGILGRFRFLMVYLASALAAGAASWVGHCYVGHSMVAGIGASGPLFGLLGTIFALHLRFRMVPEAVVRQSANIAGMVLLIGFVLEMSGYKFLDNWGHLGGILGGFLVTLVAPRPKGS